MQNNFRVFLLHKTGGYIPRTFHLIFLCGCTITAQIDFYNEICFYIDKHLQLVQNYNSVVKHSFLADTFAEQNIDEFVHSHMRKLHITLYGAFKH